MNDLKLKLILDAVDKASPELKKVDGGVSQLDTTVSKAGKAMKVFGGILAGLALGKLAADFMSVNIEFDRLEASLITVTGSEVAAKGAFKDIQDFASTTPYQLAQVTDAFIKMKALGLDASMRSLRSYGNTASAMGKDLNQMIEAVADAATGEFERLKEFGIKARQNGDKVKFIFRGATTEVKNSATDIEAYLRRIGEVEFAGGMDRQMQTLGGKLSNLSDEWSKFVRILGEAGTKDTAAWAITQATEALRDMGTAIDELSDKESSFQQTISWLNSGALQILEGLGAGNQGEFSREELDSMDLAGNYNQGSKIPIKGLDEFRDRFRTRLLELVLQQNTFRETTSGKEIPYLETTPYVPPTESQWEITAGEEIAAANKELAVQLEALHEKQAQNRKTYAGDIAAGDAMGSDVWVDFNNGLAEAQERTQVSSIQLSNDWTSALKNSLDDLADYYDDTFSDRISGSVFDAFATMEDTLIEFVNTGKASFKDLVNSILDDMLRMTIQQNISSPLSSALATGLSGLFGGGTDVAFGADSAKSFSMNANGNAFSNGRIIPFATGTIVTKPTYFPMADGNTGLMGEAGEEGILPLKRVNGKLGVSASGAGGTTVNQTIAVDARGSAVSAVDLEDAVARGAARGYQQVGEDFQRRGPLRRTLGG